MAFSLEKKDGTAKSSFPWTRKEEDEEILSLDRSDHDCQNCLKKAKLAFNSAKFGFFFYFNNFTVFIKIKNIAGL